MADERKYKAPRKHKIRRALTRPVLILGCERIPLLIGPVFIMSFVAPTGFGDWRVDLGGALAFPLWYALVRRLAKYDPRFMAKIYEHMAWQESYRAHRSMPKHLHQRWYITLLRKTKLNIVFARLVRLRY